MSPTLTADRSSADLPLASKRQAIRHVVLDRLVPTVVWGGLLCLSVSGFYRTVISGADTIEIIHRTLGISFTALMAALFLIRHPVIDRHARPLEAVVALAGTFLGPYVATAPPIHHAPTILAASSLLATVGFVWSIIALATLGRCFGLFPEARGLITHGPYRFVRHPLYLGEMTLFLGLIVLRLSPGLAMAALAWIVLQLWRARNEERALRAVFPEYATYAARTKRVIPFVW